ncbi:unnamed protein product [Prorocentrum cordatum]|uniref:DNA2/NAM7 helicase-like C-terminal domain-containing protein n=1 Tax=Prorocentrum cordatum TaxID=2364126 RepID=A0ABN9VK38_9DINO|nr:unnamed protein product [Polarella glacialis]
MTLKVSEGESKFNPGEAELITRIVQDVFFQRELEITEIGVVTPYVAQVRMLKRMLRNIVPEHLDPDLLECASVDNFQGREKDLIIFSAVRCNRTGTVGFLADWRRLNVMLTRARKGIVIVGSSRTLKDGGSRGNQRRIRSGRTAEMLTLRRVEELVEPQIEFTLASAREM